MVTDTASTGTGVTVTVAEPFTPSLVAVMLAVPGATLETSPFASTVATAALELDHEMARPASVLPIPSRSTATACVLCPVVRLGALSVTVTAATGCGLTVSDAAPVTPSLVAEIDALPGATAVTRPDELTVATALLELDQTTDRPVSADPVLSRRRAVACVVEPATRSDAVSETVTDATGEGGGGAGVFTVIVADPATPSAVAVMLAVPALT